MRGTGRTQSPFPAARALIAGAAILAGAAAPRAFAQTEAGLPGGDDTALAIPRWRPRSTGRGPAAAAAAQRGGADPPYLRPAARRRAARGGDARRRCSTPTLRWPGWPSAAPCKATFWPTAISARSPGRATEELQAWLAQWPDLADAPAIHALLMNRGCRAAPALPPRARHRHAVGRRYRPRPPPPRCRRRPSRWAKCRRATRRWTTPCTTRRARAGRTAVQRLLAHTRGLSPVYAALLRGEAAQILFTLNRDQEAYDGPPPAALRLRRAADTCHGAALAGYAAGLAAWRMNRPRPRACRCSRRLAGRSGHLRPARRHRLLGGPRASAAARPGRLRAWMTARRRGTAHLLRHAGAAHARPRIGFGPGGRDARETLGEADIDAVAATPQGIARLRPAAGRPGPPRRGRTAPPVARGAGAPALGARRDAGGREGRAGRTGRPARRSACRRPTGGRATTCASRCRGCDPAGGFTRRSGAWSTDSRAPNRISTPSLVSAAGARGLMQIMPETASFIVGSAAPRRPSGTAARPGGEPRSRPALCRRTSPAMDAVGGDLIRLLASYNAGPGNFATGPPDPRRWRPAAVHRGDPGRRNPRVRAAGTDLHWIYAARLHLPTTSLDELAAGSWPRYHALETQRAERSAQLH